MIQSLSLHAHQDLDDDSTGSETESEGEDHWGVAGSASQVRLAKVCIVSAIFDCSSLGLFSSYALDEEVFTRTRTRTRTHS